MMTIFFRIFQVLILSRWLKRGFSLDKVILILMVFIVFLGVGHLLKMLVAISSGGISILVKSCLRKGVSIIDKESCDDFVWWKLDKTFFKMQRDIYLCSVYIPPQNSSRERQLNHDHFEELQESIYKFIDKGEIILCGDFNARMGVLDGVIPDDKYNVSFNFSSAKLVSDRSSKDNQINFYGRQLNDLCIGNDLITLNGRTKGDRLGQFTCVTYNGASIVDYVLVSGSLFPRIKQLIVSQVTQFSHHCPLSFTVEANFSFSSDQPIEIDAAPTSSIWNNDLVDMFSKTISSYDVCSKFNDLFDFDNFSGNIDDLVSDFSNILVDVSSKIFLKKKFSKRKKKSLQN